MNHIAGMGIRFNPGRISRLDAALRRSLFCIASLSLILTSSCSAADSTDESLPHEYSVDYRVSPRPQQDLLQVELTLGQARPLLLEMKMRADEEYFGDFAGDGEISYENGELTWQPPARGGTISWSAKSNRRKTGDRYDAFMGDSWALFRASDIVPPAATRTTKGATSNTTLSFDLPMGWSSATQYAGRNHRYAIANPLRRFDRPTGWILLGKIGTRTEEISGVQVKIAGPKNHGVRRMDMLALLAWTLPDATRLFPRFPPRLTIISASDPMWRGGLSAPSSLYVHASLPLISENGTSNLLHEIVHVGMRAKAADGADWIVEGMAEFYGLQLLLRSGSISEQRYHRVLDGLRAWSDEASTLCGDSASGPVTAKATILFHELDQEIRTYSKQEKTLDDVMRVLSQPGQTTTIDRFKNTVAELLPSGSEILDAAKLEGCTF